MNVIIYIPEQDPIKLYSAEIKKTKVEGILAVVGQEYKAIEKRKSDYFPLVTYHVNLGKWNPLRLLGMTWYKSLKRDIPDNFELYNVSFFDDNHTYARYGYVDKTYKVPVSWIRIE